MDSLVYADDKWHEGNPAIIRPLDQASWLSGIVFDGARSFEGVAPDLDLHCQRLINSAHMMGLNCPKELDEILSIARQGIAKFPKDVALYIRPMVYGTTGFIVPDPDAAAFCLVFEPMPMPPAKGFSAGFTTFRRPTPESAPTTAKASGLYANVYRTLIDARQRGFDNAVVQDANGNVAEFATANLWIVRDGVAQTPTANGCFLNGITRQRMITLFKDAGIPVEECTLTREDILAADEIFNSGNYGKVMPVTRIEDRELPIGPIATKARQLYFEWAHDTHG